MNSIGMASPIIELSKLTDRIVSVASAFEARFFTSLQQLSPKSYRSRRFGRWTALFWSNAVDFTGLEQIEDNLCLLSDKEIVKWKDSYVSICNAAGVAVSLRIRLLVGKTNQDRAQSSVK